MNHDMIAIGGSAGAIEVLLELVAELPADLPASLFVVVHVVPSASSRLAELLNQRGRLPASHPLHNEKIFPGHVYVAAPDTHLLLRQGLMEVVRGPKENGHRPAVDALFRSASAAYGSRVIGVVLSGYQDCGTAGMMSIKARGGVAVVQLPESALASDMPRSVLERVPIDHVVTPQELPSLLTRLAATPTGEHRPVDGLVDELEGSKRGLPAELVCPACHGVLTEARLGSVESFRCHVGHAFSLESLVREQSDEMERALWAAVRSLEESAALSERLHARENNEEMRLRYAEKARTQAQHADAIRQILLHGRMLTPADART
jgi:two-component system chemotaxis response regulator CheB